MSLLGLSSRWVTRLCRSFADIACISVYCRTNIAAAKEERTKGKTRRDKGPRKEKQIDVDQKEDGEGWETVKGRASEPFRLLKQMLFPEGLDMEQLKPIDLLKKRGDIISSRGRKVTVMSLGGVLKMPP